HRIRSRYDMRSIVDTMGRVHRAEVRALTRLAPAQSHPPLVGGKGGCPDARRGPTGAEELARGRLHGRVHRMSTPPNGEWPADTTPLPPAPPPSPGAPPPEAEPGNRIGLGLLLAIVLLAAVAAVLAAVLLPRPNHHGAAPAPGV